MNPHQRRVRSMSDEIRRLRKELLKQQRELDARDKIIAEQSKIIERRDAQIAYILRHSDAIVTIIRGKIGQQINHP